MLIVTYLSIFIKYTAFYLYFYLFGKFIISKIFKFTKEGRSKELLFTKTEYLAPLFGLLILGNLLIILNIFTPLNNIYINIFLILLPFLSLKRFRIDIKKYLNTNFIFNYLVIPGILVISTVDITFNYDAGYYHLLHQNWIRESEVIVGMVNIFFALGMSSIYEYLSAILWFDSSFVYLHFLNIYFFKLTI